PAASGPAHAADTRPRCSRGAPPGDAVAPTGGGDSVDVGPVVPHSPPSPMTSRRWGSTLWGHGDSRYRGDEIPLLDTQIRTRSGDTGGAVRLSAAHRRPGAGADRVPRGDGLR